MERRTEPLGSHVFFVSIQYWKSKIKQNLFYLMYLCCNAASILYIMLRLQLLIRCHWSLKRNFIMKLLNEDLTSLKFLSVVLIAIIIFFIFKGYLKSQIKKNCFSNSRYYFTKITGRNFCDLTLFFAKLAKIYTRKLFGFLKFF